MAPRKPKEAAEPPALPVGISDESRGGALPSGKQKVAQTAADRRNWLRKQAGWPVKGN